MGCMLGSAGSYLHMHVYVSACNFMNRVWAAYPFEAWHEKVSKRVSPFARDRTLRVQVPKHEVSAPDQNKPYSRLAITWTP